MIEPKYLANFLFISLFRVLPVFQSKNKLSSNCSKFSWYSYCTPQWHASLCIAWLGYIHWSIAGVQNNPEVQVLICGYWEWHRNPNILCFQNLRTSFILIGYLVTEMMLAFIHHLCFNHLCWNFKMRPCRTA